MTNEQKIDLVTEVEELLAKATPGELHVGTAFKDAVPERAIFEGDRYLFTAPEADWFTLNQIVTRHNRAPELLRRLVEEVKRLRIIEDAYNAVEKGRDEAWR